MKTATFKKFVEVEEQYKALEAIRSDLRTKIVEELQKEEVVSLDSEFGKFTIATRTSYSYSDKVKALEEKVKMAKLKEEQKGEAKAKQTNYLVYSAV